jgi:hypothetical protein
MHPKRTTKCTVSNHRFYGFTLVSSVVSSLPRCNRMTTVKRQFLMRKGNDFINTTRGSERE